LRVTGKVERPLVIREVDLQVLPHKSLAVNDDKGAHVTYDGRKRAVIPFTLKDAIFNRPSVGPATII
jgi:hypothetical protein